SHARGGAIRQARGRPGGWEWAKRLAANPGVSGGSSRDVPSVVAKGEYAVGFGVPSYFVFEEKLAGFDIKFTAPKAAFVTPEPFAILAGARHPRAAREFLAFLLSEAGQRRVMGRGLFPGSPRDKGHGPPGLPTRIGGRVRGGGQPTGGIRSLSERPVTNVYDDDVARARFREVNERFRRDIETAWNDPKRR